MFSRLILTTMKKTLIAVLIIGFTTAGYAHEEGQWLLKAGLTNVDPKSSNHEVVDADAGAALNLNATYFFTDSLALDVLAAIPFEHDVVLKDGTKVGDTKQLPPTVSLNYFFNNGGRFRPYIGAGVNYTTFFSEGTTGPLAGSDLDLDDSWGLSVQVGADWAINDRWFVNFDVRKMDIDSDAQLDGADLGTVEIDPLVYGISFGYQL